MLRRVLFILLFDFLPLPVVLDFFVLFDFFPLFLGLELEDFFPLFDFLPLFAAKTVAFLFPVCRKERCALNVARAY